ncbi:MAG: hypothetical protein ABIK28_10800 [Planctomycetota bacterium]
MKKQLSLKNLKAAPYMFSLVEMSLLEMAVPGIVILKWINIGAASREIAKFRS